MLKINKKTLPFWILTIAFFILVIAPSLIQEGMFMDGLLYLGVSKNMAQGIGTFWEPIFSYSWHYSGSDFFHEQPPLGFGLQAIFFKIFGFSIYVERLYSFLVACITAYLIFKIWNKVTQDKFKNISWLPILLWITIPISFWSIHNNILENTLSVFTLFSVLFLLNGLHAKKNKNLLFIVGGFFVFLATFTKGVPGLFPLAVIPLYYLIYRKSSFIKSILWTMIPILTVTTAYLLMLTISEGAFNSFKFYLQERLIGRINSSPTVDNRYWILGKLFLELVPIMLLTLIFLAITKNKKNISHINFKHVLLFFSIGICASIPLTLTMIQRPFYFSPSLPFFGIAAAFIIAPLLSQFITKINTASIKFQIFKILSSIAIIASITVTIISIGKTKRDELIINDIKTLSTVIPYNSTVKTTPKVNQQWSNQVYAMRYHNLHLDARKEKAEYHLFYKNTEVQKENLELVALNLKLFKLYKIKTPNE
jgi:4-amino-4-deoxy-L-arabinose transferase-like glycosyltransferase